jgi:hypothetical protein
MTVGSGIAPDLLTPLYLSILPKGYSWALAGSQEARLRCLHTAGGEFHPALKTH